LDSGKKITGEDAQGLYIQALDDREMQKGMDFFSDAPKATPM
jgi:hypothetical protein